MDYQNIPLFQIIPGKEYVIDSITDTNNNTLSFRGYGITPGAKIKLLFASPSGDPCAYEILGTVIALRHKDSRNIHIKNTAASD